MESVYEVDAENVKSADRVPVFSFGAPCTSIKLQENRWDFHTENMPPSKANYQTEDSAEKHPDIREREADNDDDDDDGERTSLPNSSSHRSFSCSKSADEIVMFSSNSSHSYLTISGLGRVKVLHGAIEILGFRVTSISEWSPTIFAPAELSFFNIEPKVTRPAKTSMAELQRELEGYELSSLDLKAIERGVSDRKTVIALKSERDKTYSYVSHHLKTQLTCYEDCRKTFRLGREESAVHIDNSWRKQINAIGQCLPEVTPKVLVCGGKNLGKSTLSRYICNKFLSNYCKELYYLDCDPGQSEFTPPGLVSLTKVNKPVFGANFTHQMEPEKCYFAGGISVDKPRDYLNCIMGLNTYRQTTNPTTPVVVNTMGWNEGLGVALLIDLIRMIKPTHVIELHSGNYSGRNFPRRITPEYANDCDESRFIEFDYESDLEFEHLLFESVPARNGKPSLLQTPKMMRTASTLAYFSRFQISHHIVPLNQLDCCYIFPWNSIQLAVSNNSLPPSDVLYAFNGSIVALCRAQDENNIPPQTEESELRIVTLTKPAEWIGYGVVRGIDVEEKSFYILSHLTEEELDGVTVIVKSSVNLPLELLTNQETKDGCSIPYLAVCDTDAKVKLGSAVMKGRKFKERSRPNADL